MEYIVQAFASIDAAWQTVASSKIFFSDYIKKIGQILPFTL
jgi:hypothetical protein